MAKITVEVKGVNTGGGNNNQNQNNPPQQPPQPSSPQPPTQQPTPTPTPSQPQQTTGTQQPTAPAQPTPPNVSSKPYQRKSDEDDSRTTNKPNYQRSTDDGSGQPAASPTPSGKPYQRSVDTTQGGQQNVPQTAQTPHPGAATQAANQFSGNQPGFIVETGDGNGGTRTIFNQPGQDTGTKTQDDTLPDDDEVINPNQPPVSSPPVQPTPPTQPSQPAPPTQQPNQPNQPSQQPNKPTPPTPIPPPYQYQRINLNQYKPNRLGATPAIPGSDRMVEDIRREITQRGVLLVPGTANFSTMMNTLQQNQRSAINANILSPYDKNVQTLKDAKEAAENEVQERIQRHLQSALNGVTDPVEIDKILKSSNAIENQEYKRIDALFNPLIKKFEDDRENAVNQSEENLTKAIELLTEEIKQGNPDSYLNRLKDDYKTAIYKRDNAMTEADAIEASKEAAKIQERMARAQGAPNQNLSRLTGTLSGMISTGMTTAIQYDRNMIYQENGLGFDMASSILNGNATAAVRQRNAAKEQMNTAVMTGGGALAGLAAGALAGTVIPGIGNVAGAIIGLVAGALGGAAGYGGAHLMNRNMYIEDERTKAVDLWRNEEQRMMQYNSLSMMMRPFAGGAGIDAIRETLMRQSAATTPGMVGGSFVRGDDHLDLYDLGYTAPEFANQVTQRSKARGFSRGWQDFESTLRADALERVYNMNTGSLNALSQYDRFGKNNATQDFANLAETLSSMNTLGMSDKNGGYMRSDEFLGYMTQLGQSQRSTFLTVDNARSARQIATGQAMFGTKFGAEAMQGIQAVNNQVQNPGGGYAKTLLYDVIQELYPDTRGDIKKIREAQYDPAKQNKIQQAFAKRVQEMYGGVDTTSGFLAFEEIYGISNPNVLNPIIKQMTQGGGLEARGLKKGNVNAKTDILNNEGYTPRVTQKMNNMADQQSAQLLNSEYQESMTRITDSILKTLQQDIAGILQKAVDKLN